MHVVLKKFTLNDLCHSVKFSCPGFTDAPLPTLQIKTSNEPRTLTALFITSLAPSSVETSPDT